MSFETVSMKIHLIAAGTHTGVAFSLSPGHRHDAPEGRKLLRTLTLRRRAYVAMDKGYADRKTRATIRRLHAIPVVPPKSNTRKPWKYNTKIYKKRNEIERLFHHLKNFRRIATRYDKLDIVFRSFVALGLTLLSLRNC